jgi:two-component system chemotaxis response regulator CheB
LSDRPLRVLVVDDSVLYRMSIRRALVQIPGVEVVDSAVDGKQALEKLAQHDPDLLTLDVQMPGTDGIEVLREMRRRGVRARAVMVSSLTAAGAAATTDALLEGAFDFLCKPAGSDPEQNLRELRDALQERIDAFRATCSDAAPASRATTFAAATPEAATPARTSRAAGHDVPEVVVVASSTGGPEALRVVLPALPASLSVPVLVVQHMPADFTAALARRLAELCPLPVVEGRDGMAVERGKGRIVVAPGGLQTRIRQEGTGALRMRCVDEPPENGCRPAADFLLRSVAPVFGAKALAVVLTGMGRDGTSGCRDVKEHGGRVIAQAAEGCIVFGMPRSVIEAGLADQVAELPRIADAIVDATAP